MKSTTSETENYQKSPVIVGLLDRNPFLSRSFHCFQEKVQTLTVWDYLLLRIEGTA